MPANTLIVKGAWTSSSDSITPVPEDGRLNSGIYANAYFGLDFALPLNWTKTYDGPPPSDSGYYSLLQLTPAETAKGATGSVLITAQDLFFAPSGVANTEQLVRFARDHLQADYQVEREPSQIELAGRSFIRFDYGSAVAGLHWRVLATQIRCHVVQFIFTGRDPQVLETLVRQAGRMSLPPEAGLTSGSAGGTFPACVPDYVRDVNILKRVDPVFTERRFNPVPVRILIDREGKVKHVHLLSAFPDQSRSVMEAMRQWRFKPYLRDGKPVEVETGVYFGQMHRPLAPLETADQAHYKSARMPPQSLRISNPNGLVGAPALQVDAGHEESAIKRSISARSMIEAPARVLGGRNDKRPSAATSAFIKKFSELGSGSGSMPSSRNAEHRLS